jgi:hypothetical protein
VVRRPGLLRAALRAAAGARPAGLRAGDYTSLFALIGSKSALDEAEEEIAAVAHGLEQEKKQ